MASPVTAGRASGRGADQRHPCVDYVLIENVDFEASDEDRLAATDVIEAHLLGGDLNFVQAAHTRLRQRLASSAADQVGGQRLVASFAAESHALAGRRGRWRMELRTTKSDCLARALGDGVTAKSAQEPFKIMSVRCHPDLHGTSQTRPRRDCTESNTYKEFLAGGDTNRHSIQS